MAGMGWIINDLMEWVAFVLIEKTLNSTLPGGIGAGAQTIALVDPAIYVGALLIVDAGVNQEIIMVSAITGAGFTATFTFPHLAGVVIKGATFPSGQVNQVSVGNMAAGAGSKVSPLFTQAEILGYIKDVENDYIERVRPMYKVGTAALLTGNPVGTLPTDVVRVDRVDIEGVALWSVSESELDLTSQDSQLGQSSPSMWWWDKLGLRKFAVSPKPPVNLTAELFYSNKRTATPVLTDSFVIPDIFVYILKYGVLAACFGKEGEMRDLRRAAICAKRYERGVQYGKKFMRSIQVEMDFSKMARAGV